MKSSLALFSAGSIVEHVAASSPRVMWFSGEPFVSMRDISRFYGMEYLRPSSEVVELKSRWSNLVFNTKSRRFELNGVVVWLHEGPRIHRNDWIITRTDAQRMIDPILRPNAHLRGRTPRVVVIDPGHGGRDKGAVGGRNVQEKLAVMDISRRMRAHLETMKIRSVLTRDSDVFLSLDRRVQISNRNRADLFVSVHLNASTNASAHGIESFILTSPGFPSTNSSDRKRVPKIAHPGTPFDNRSTAAGYALQRHMLDTTGAEDRGLRQSRFHVLKEVKAPAVLVEGGFLSNRREQDRILHASYRDRLALGVARGISEYFNHCRRAQLQ